MPKRVPLKLTASSLRLILLAGVGAAIILQVGVISLGQHVITSYGQEVAAAVSIAKSNEETLRSLESVDTVLRDQAETARKAQGIVAGKTDPYIYQNQIIKDLTAYSQIAGIQITGYTFSDNSVTAKPSGSSAAAATATGPATAAGKSAAIPAGVSPITVTLTIAPGMHYGSFYKFLQLIEGNLLRMEVQGLNLSRATGQDVSLDTVALTTLTLQVYKQK